MLHFKQIESFCGYLLLHEMLSTLFNPYCTIEHYGSDCFYLNDDKLVYIFYVHSAHFVLWFVLNLFYFKTLHKQIYTLPMLIFYHNFHYYFNSSDIYYRFSYYKLKQSLLWFFTSPNLIKMYEETNQVDMIRNIHTDILLHILNCTHAFLGLKTVEYFNRVFENFILIMMYVLYFYNMYSICSHKNIPYHKYFFLYSLCLFGMNETLLIFKMINYQCYILMSLFLDIQFKSLLFALNVFKHQEVKTISQKTNISNFKTIARLSQLINDNNHLFTNSIKSDISNISKNMNIDDIKFQLSDRVLCKDFSDNFIRHLMIRNKKLKNIVIFFSDLVNYTKMSIENSNDTIVEKLQTLYESYDNLLLQYPALQKVENIGDCYMVTTLLDDTRIHNRQTDKCMSMFEFSKKIIKISNSMNIYSRVGLHIGDVAMGIIGKDIPRFGVVGHAVNVASRLESTSDINSIHMSREFKKALDKEEFDTSEFILQKIYLKNIGKYTTYKTNIITQNEQAD